MANSTTTIVSLGADGKFSLPSLSHADVARVDVFDVDLLLTDKNGNRYVLPNAAVDAMGSLPPSVVLSGEEVSASALLKEVGVTTDVDPNKMVPSSVKPEDQKDHKDKQEQDIERAKKEKEILEKKIEKLEHEVDAQKKQHEEDAKKQHEQDARHDKAGSLTTNTEGAVEQLVKEAARIEENLHTKDYDYTPAKIYNPPPSPITAADGVPAPLSMTPFVSITIGNMVGTTTVASTIYGGGGALGTGADAYLGPRDPLQFSAATIAGTAGNDVIYTNGPLTGNADPSLDRSNNAKQIILNIAGYFTSLQDIRIDGVPVGVSILGAADQGGGTWLLPSAYGAAATPFSIVYNMDSWRSGASTFDLSFTVAGEGAKGQFFNTTQIFRFMYMDVTDVSQVTDNELVYDYKGQTKQIYVLPTMDQPNIINSGEGDDQIYAGRNADTITVGNGNNLIYTYQGDDTVTTGTGNNTVYLGDGNNSLSSSSGNDVVQAGDGNNTISVGGGTNSVTLGNGVNSVVSGTGDDTIVSGTGSLTVHAGDGNNSVTTAATVINILTGIGNDVVLSTSGSGTIDVGDGTNSVTVGNGTNTILGGSGNDTIVTGSGAVTINAGAGANTITTHGAVVNITSGVGNDIISAIGGSGAINAGDGTNSVTVTTGNFSITTGAGVDTVSVGDGNNTINVGGGNNTVTAGNGNNVFIGGSGNDSFTAGNGNNTFGGGLGTNAYVGGSGQNTVDYTTISTTAITVLLAAGTATGTGLADTLTNIQNVVGSAQNDTITGNSFANVLNGGDGNDTIVGGGGNDTLYGGNGNDTITGGTGNDIIYAGDGDNTVYTGTAGADFVYGGTGNNTFVSQHAGVTYNGTNGQNIVNGVYNTVDYSADTVGMTINLQGGYGAGGLANGDVYVFTPTSGVNSINKIIAGSGNDTITDSNGNDSINGGGGTNTYNVNNGNDTFIGGSGQDQFITSGIGNKVYIGNGGNNYYDLGLATENVVSGSGWDMVRYYRSGIGVLVNLDSVSHSVVNSAGQTVTVAALSGASWGAVAADANSYAIGDTFSGGSVDYFLGSSGNDVVWDAPTGSLQFEGYGGTDWFFGGSGNSFIRNTDNDRLDGGGGSGDTLYVNGNTNGNAFTSNNVVVYLDGNVDLNGNGTMDYIDRGISSLTISAANSPTGSAITYTGFVTGYNGTSYLKNIEYILSESGNDLLVGDGSDNIINGRGGNNTLYGMGGNDTLHSAVGGINTLYGGTGTDTVDFSNSWNGSGTTTAAYVFFADATFMGASDKLLYMGSANMAYQAKTDGGTVAYIYETENITGSSLNDVLYGDSTANTIIGNDGNDIIAGNGGADALYGNNGNDTFYATAAQVPTTTLFDGGAGTDTLKVAGLALTAGSITGAKFNSIETLDIRNSASGGSYSMNANDIVGLADNGTSSSLTLKLDTGDTFNLSVGAGTGALSYVVASSTATDTIYYLYSDAGHVIANATNRVAILDVYTGAG